MGKAPVEPEKTAVRPSLEVGDVFADRYEIRGLLGHGTYGEVYAASDRGPLRRMVALKVIRPELAGPDARDACARFLEEARLAASLSHPRIATVFEAGEGDGRVYMTQELVQGRDLRKVLDEGGPWAVQQALVAALQVCDALVYAHGRSIVHRDIKPGNILVDERGFVKITDFGMALVLQPRGEGEEETLPRLLAGTPGYMAPEQITGERVDARADIFAVGCVLHKLLTGRHPFEAETTTGVIQKTLQELPTRPSQWRDDLPPALDHVVARACSKEPNSRYESAAQLGRDLLACLAHLNLALEQQVTREYGLGWAADAAPEGARSITARVPIARAALGILILITLTLVAAVPSLRRRVQTALGISAVPAVQQLAVLPFNVVGADSESRAFADGLTDTIAAKLVGLAQEHPLQVVPSAEVHSERVATAEEARTQFGVNLVVSGTLQRSGNSVRVLAVLIDPIRRRQVAADTIDAAASDPFALEDRVVSSVVQMLRIEPQPKEQRALNQHGTTEPGAYDYYLRGRGYLLDYNKPESIESAILLFGHALDLDGNNALAEAGLGRAYWYKYELTHDSSFVEKSQAACHRAVKLQPEVAAGHSCLGLAYRGTGEYERAASELRQAVVLDPSDPDSYRDLASAYASLGKLEEAEQSYKKAIGLLPQYWGGYNKLGKFYSDHARYEEAAEMFQHVVALAPDNPRGYSNLGGTYVTLGRYADAIPMFERSATLQPTSAAYSNLATVYFQLRRFTDAAQAYLKAVQLDPHSYVGWGNLADCEYLAPGQQDRAPEHYRKAISLAEEQLRVNPRDADVTGDLADYHSMLGERAVALACLKKAFGLAPQSAGLKFQAAEVHNQLGDTDDAIRWLQKAVKAGYSLSMIRDTPMLDNLRSDPRVQALVAGR